MKKKRLLMIIILAMIIAFIPNNSVNAMSDSRKSELEEMFRDVGFAATVSGGELEFEEGENVKPGMAFWYLSLNQRLEKYMDYTTWCYELTIDQYMEEMSLAFTNYSVDQVASWLQKSDYYNPAKGDNVSIFLGGMGDVWAWEPISITQEGTKYRIDGLFLSGNEDTGDVDTLTDKEFYDYWMYKSEWVEDGEHYSEEYAMGISRSFSVLVEDTESGLLVSSYKVLDYYSHNGMVYCRNEEIGKFDYAFTVELEYDSTVYDGTAKTPSCKVLGEGEMLVDESSYDVAYKNNVGIGKATAVCTINMDTYHGEISLDFEIKEGDHIYGEWEQTKAPTCTKAGSQKRECKNCDEVETKSVKKLGHKYATSYTTDKKATCTKAGSKSKHCTRCNAKTSVTEIPKLGHTYKTVLKKATLTKNGKKTSECKVCGYVASKSTTYYAPKTIKLSTTKYTYNGKVKEPSVSVKDSKGNTLKEGTDYTVTYASGRKNVGRYTVTVKFKGNYSGEKKLTFYVLPSKTSKITPTSTTTTIKASWKKVTGATGYKVELLSSKGKVLQTKYTENLNYTFKSLSKVTTYKVRVTAYKTISGTKYYSLSSTTFTTSTAPAAPTLKVKAGSKKADLSWNKVTGTGYEIQYATNSKFTSAKTVTVSKNTTLKKTVSGLTNGKTYYFKIRAYKTVDGTKVYGSWSTVKSVKLTSAASSTSTTKNNSNTVYTTETGSKYHSTKNCSGLNNAKKIYTDSLSDAKSIGLEPCKKCH